MDICTGVEWLNTWYFVTTITLVSAVALMVTALVLRVAHSEWVAWRGARG